MQTFLPYPSFTRSARVLDRKRLGKQRVEVLQILRALAGLTRGWRHHPAVRMWSGYEDALVLYGLAMSREWRRRGYRDTCLEKIVAFAPAGALRPRRRPPWLGDAALHRSHQSALVRKDPAHYRPLFPDVPDDLPLLWPAGAQALRDT